MLLNFDVGAAIGVGGAFITLGTIIAGMFWRLMSRIERKVDHVVDSMTTKEQCAVHRQAFEEMFNGHDHTKEGDLVIIRREHGQVYQETEGLPQGRGELLSEGVGKVVGKTL